ARSVVYRLDAEAGVQARSVERTRGPDVDRRADATGRGGSTARLVDLDRRDRLGGKVREIEGTRIRCAGVLDVGTRHLPAVQQYQVEVGTETADRDLGSFTERAVDRHAGDALQGLREVGIGEFADVLGNDPVDHALGVALEAHRGFHRTANAGDDDLVHVGRFFGRMYERGAEQRSTQDQGDCLCDRRAFVCADCFHVPPLKICKRLL